jgi:Holliday junction resolvase RusA-like endonuclease
MLLFIVNGEPRGKGRPRFTRDGHVYTDAKTREYEEEIREAFAEAGGVMTDKAVMVSIVVHHGVPARWSKKVKRAALDNKIAPIRKPDVDNIGKIVLDALNGVAWKDDRQVVSLTVAKAWTKEAYVGVFVREMDYDGRPDNA